MKDLAIVIPAYKTDYLAQTLDSFAQQSCKNFTIYVGDDCSPHDIRPIVEIFSARMDIRYHRFENNLGSKDLVKQWERCIELTENEPWIWLFSDDDLVSPNCVDFFYKTIYQTDNQQIFSNTYNFKKNQAKKVHSYKLFHFDTLVIEEDNTLTQDQQYIKPSFPKEMSAAQFLKARLQYKINSFVVEYIFARSLYYESGGFVNFDMAWGSDDATWFKMSHISPILTINHAKVYWRKSTSNITPDNSKSTILRKMHATIEYLSFCYHHLSDNQQEYIEFGHKKLILFNYFFHALINASNTLNHKELKTITENYKRQVYPLRMIPSCMIVSIAQILMIIKKIIIKRHTKNTQK